MTIEDSVLGFPTVRGPPGAVMDGARLTLRRTSVYRTVTPLDATAAQLDLEDVEMHDVRLPTPRIKTTAVRVTMGGRLTATRVSVEAVRGDAIAVAAGSTAQVTEFRATRIGFDDQPDVYGDALSTRGGSLSAERAWIDGSYGGCLWASQMGARLDVRSLLCRGVDGRGTRTSRSNGITISAMATATVEAVAILETARAGLQADTGAMLTVRDLHVRDIRAAPDGLYGFGAWFSRGAIVRGERVRVERATWAAIAATDSGSDVDLRDVWIDETRAPYGVGVTAYGAAHVVVRNGWVRGSLDVAAGASFPGARLELADVVFDGVGTLSDTSFGVGVFATAGGIVSAERVAVIGVRGAAFASSGGVGFASPDVLRGSRATLVDGFVRRVSTGRVRYRLQAGAPVPDGESAAYGLHVGAECSLVATRVAVLNGGFGVVATGGSVRWETGIVSGQLDAAGAVLGDPSATLAGIRDVLFRDNALDAVVTRAGLSEASSLPPPTSVCIVPPCM